MDSTRKHVNQRMACANTSIEKAHPDNLVNGYIKMPKQYF